jgi:hypothetical protein
MDGIAAMKSWRGEWARGSAQIAAQSEGIIDLNDNQRLAARISIFGITGDRAVLAKAVQLRSATSRTSTAGCPTTIGATTSGAAITARSSHHHTVI